MELRTALHSIWVIFPRFNRVSNNCLCGSENNNSNKISPRHGSLDSPV